jgi:hypothetical protein
MRCNSAKAPDTHGPPVGTFILFSRRKHQTVVHLVAQIRVSGNPRIQFWESESRSEIRVAIVAPPQKTPGRKRWFPRQVGNFCRHLALLLFLPSLGMNIPTAHKRKLELQAFLRIRYRLIVAVSS